MKTAYMYLMTNSKPLDDEIIKKHIIHLKFLDKAGKLAICGPFTDYPGGMVAFYAATPEEAMNVANSDPFISEGYKSFELRTIEVADASNNYLG